MNDEVQRLEKEIERLKKELQDFRNNHKGSSCKEAPDYEECMSPQYGDWE